ncbi:MAG: hypothetical protein WC943_06180 [Elusimicrobiota bacterium]|jgi:hypothetical protein
MMLSIKARLFHVLASAAGLLVYSGVAAAIALRHVPAGTEPLRWAMLAAFAAPIWVAGGAALAAIVDGVSQTLFKRGAFGLGLGIVFGGTMLLNAGQDAGRVAKLMGISLGALFLVAFGTCVVLLPVFFIRHRLKLRGHGADTQGRI